MKFMRFLGLPIFLCVFAAAAAVVMLLWNWLIPGLIGWGVLGFWQAAGLLLLCRLLFGSFGHRGHWGHHMRGWHARHGFRPEDREKMREAMWQTREAVKNMNKDQRREYIRDHMFCGRPGEENREREDGGK